MNAKNFTIAKTYSKLKNEGFEFDLRDVFWYQERIFFGIKIIENSNRICSQIF